MNFKEKLMEELMELDDFVTLTFLSQKTRISYPTVLKWVEVLKSEGLIEDKRFGSSRLVKIKE